MIPFKDEPLAIIITFALIVGAGLELVGYPKPWNIVAAALSIALIILGILTYIANLE